MCKVDISQYSTGSGQNHETQGCVIVTLVLQVRAGPSNRFYWYYSRPTTTTYSVAKNLHNCCWPTKMSRPENPLEHRNVNEMRACEKICAFYYMCNNKAYTRPSLASCPASHQRRRSTCTSLPSLPGSKQEARSPQQELADLPEHHQTILIIIQRYITSAVWDDENTGPEK